MQEVCRAEVSLVEVCSGEVCLVEVCSDEVCRAEVCLDEFCRAEVCRAEDRLVEVCFAEVCLVEVCLVEVCLVEVCFAEVRRYWRILFSPLVPSFNPLLENLEMFLVCHGKPALYYPYRYKIPPPKAREKVNSLDKV